MAAAPLTDLDIALIAQWARSPWRVAHSLANGQPERPELEGGSLARRDLLSHIDLPAPVNELFYEASHPRIYLYGLTAVPLERYTVHSITWTTVGHWLDLWTTPDRHRAIRLNRDRAAAWERPDERLAPPVCFDSKATGAACERRNDRLYGTRREIDVVRRYDTELDQLIGSYLTPRQPSLF